MGFYDAIRIGASSAVDSTFTVDRSLRFNRSDSAYLTRSQSSPTNAKKATVSTWLKRTDIDTGNTFFEIGYQGTTNRCSITLFDNIDGNKLGIFQRDSSGIVCNLSTTQVFRDPSAWYHIVIAFDTTQSTAADRVKIYINGTQVTDFDSSVYYSQNHDLTVGSGYNTNIGYYGAGSNYYGGYMAEVNFIDGQQLTPSSFAETNSDTGQWNPKKYTGSYGTNGFYLNFSDNSGTTATTLGKDSSGNGNNFTPNNFSVSAGEGNDSLEDTPTNNFCTLNPLDVFGDGVAEEIKNGNLEAKNTSGSYRMTRSTFHFTTGKWYWEVKVLNAGSATLIGVAGKDYAAGSGARRVYSTNGQKYTGSGSSYGASYTTNDIIGIALDLDNGTLTFYKNGSSQGVAFTDILTAMVDGGWTPVFNGYGNSEGAFNFGQRAFDYTQPTGYKKLNSANLPDPTILLPNQHFNTVLYSGDGNSTKSITGVGFKSDWLWLKGRNTNYSHLLYDAVRGAGLEKGLNSNETRAEGSVVGDNSTFGYLNSFDSDGFSVTKGSDSTSYTNGGSSTYVAWNWNAGDTDGKTYTVKVVSDGGNKYRFDDFGTSAVTLDLAEGGTYIFDGSDSSMASHPIKLSETSNGTHGGGSSYNTGVTYLLDGASVTESAYVSGYSSATTRQLKIVVAASAPTLYYYCHYHSGMGGQANTNSTLGSSNFDGSTQSTAKVNATAGFSIVTYTGTGSLTTLGHGLGVAPQVVITKPRSATGSWGVLHTVGDPTAENRLHLNDNGGYSSYQGYKLWGDTVPTSSVFTVREDASTNASSVTYVAYVLSEVAGYSKFGKYTGNASDNGTFVFTGFRPAWIMFKSSNANVGWYILDNKRNPSNVVNKHLRADSSGSEQTDTFADFLSNGFKFRTSDSSGNTDYNYIYFAFAEAPFKNARAR